MYREEGGYSSAARSFSRPEEVINTEIQILNSRALRKKVIERMGIENLYPELVKTDDAAGSFSPISALRNGVGWVLTSIKGLFSPPAEQEQADNQKAVKLTEKAMKLFAKGLSVTAAQKSHVIHLHFVHTDRKMAEYALKLLIEVFTEERLGIFSDAKASFLEEQLVESERKLADAAKAIEEYKTKKRLYQIDEQTRLLLSEVNHLSRKHRAVVNKIAELKQRIATTESQMKSVRREIYSKLEIELIQLRSDWTSAQAKQRSYDQQLTELQNELQRVELARQELQDLERELLQQEQNFLQIRKSAEEERITVALDEARRTNIRIIQEPMAPLKRLGLRKRQQVLLSAVLGLLFGFAGGALVELRRGVFYDPESAGKALGVPVLAVIPAADSRKEPA